MKNYSIFHPIIMAFYAKSIYQDVAKNWRGIGASYLLLLLAIAWLPFIIQSNMGLRLFARNVAPQWIQQIPTITVKEGAVAIDKPEPYFIKDPSSNETVVIFDTTGHYTNLQNTSAHMLVTKTQIITRKNQQETHIYQLGKTDNYLINQEKAEQFVRYFLWSAPVFAYIAFVFATFIYRLLQALLYALFGFIYSRFIKFDISYHTVYRLTVVALTPVIVISSILTYLHVFFPYQWVIYLVLGLSYTLFAVKACHDQQQDLDLIKNNKIT